MQLAKIEEFEPYCAYRMIDTINKREVHPDDIFYFFMQEKQMAFDLENAALFIKVFDAEKKGYLDIHK